MKKTFDMFFLLINWPETKHHRELMRARSGYGKEKFLANYAFDVVLSEVALAVFEYFSDLSPLPNRRFKPMTSDRLDDDFSIRCDEDIAATVEGICKYCKYTKHYSMTIPSGVEYAVSQVQTVDDVVHLIMALRISSVEASK